MQELTAILRGHKWQATDARKVVMPSGVESVYAFGLGVTKDRLRPMLAITAALRKPLMLRVAKLANGILRRRSPVAYWSTLHFSRDYGAAIHVDGSNMGPSYGCALGDYDNGEL